MTGNLLRLPHIHNPSQESHWTVSIFWSLAHSLIPHVDPATGSFQRMLALLPSPVAPLMLAVR